METNPRKDNEAFHLTLSHSLSVSYLSLSLSLSRWGKFVTYFKCCKNITSFYTKQKIIQKFGTQLVRGRIFQQTHSECAIPRTTFLMAASHEVLSVTSHLAATARFLPELGKAVKHQHGPRFAGKAHHCQALEKCEFTICFFHTTYFTTRLSY